MQYSHLEAITDAKTFVTKVQKYVKELETIINLYKYICGPR